MKKEEIEKIFPYAEQSTMMFAYTAFIELLKYQKERFAKLTPQKKVNQIMWNVYLNGIKDNMEKDLMDLKYEEKNND